MTGPGAPERVRTPGAPIDRWRAVPPAALLVVAVVLATALAGPWTVQGRPAGLWPMPTDIPTSWPQETGDAQAPTSPRDLPAGLSWIGTALKLAALVVLAGLVVLVLRAGVRRLLTWWRGLDRESAAPVPATGGEAVAPLDEATTAALADGLAAADRALRRELPPGDAVIAAWMALETAAARGGVERDPAQTASEFTLALLDRTSADPRAARRLLARYHAARFSTHEVTAADVAAARDALATLATALTVPDEALGPDDDASRPDDDASRPDDDASRPDDDGGVDQPPEALP